ncbi:predicted protein [Naegleria gruberi]|uniref:Predicted protein n=1 Tax=Naegleria gruberi TaxID=5762 RepID=D2V3L2_NAEGR|nr:uncharacterized protein NAEGRDRAFT_46413 [Naegleria gruberi]EFC48657.1 predicted protein [Naegleria gruberi]|eukprot:XP_002681401.1 predicted protein [Naegleria gruberi strain NEG-M]
MYNDVKKSIVDIKRIIILSKNFVALEMKYYKFGDLRNLVSPKLALPLSTHISRKILKDVSKGLLKLKENNIVHCDVKLENIFIEKLDQQEARIRVILGDFGVSTFGTDDETHLKGTMKYLSPEAQYEHDYSSKSDVYALGVVMKCLTQNDPHVNREFLDKMTHPIKGERYDIEDVRKNLDDIILIKRHPIDVLSTINDECEIIGTSIVLNGFRYSATEYLEITNLQTGETSMRYFNEYIKLANWCRSRDSDMFNASDYCGALFIFQNSKNVIILFQSAYDKGFAVFNLNFALTQIIVYPTYFPNTILDMKVQEETVSIKTKEEDGDEEWVEYPHPWWNSEMRETIFSNEDDNYNENSDYTYRHQVEKLETYLTTSHDEPPKSFADELKLFSNFPYKIEKLEKETSYGVNIYSFPLENCFAGVCILSKRYKIFEYVVNNVNVDHFSDPAFHQALERKKAVVAWEFLSDYIVMISNVQKMTQIAETNETLIF